MVERNLRRSEKSNNFCIQISYLPYIYEKSGPVGFFSDSKEQFKSSTLFVISTTTVFVVFQMITIEYDCYSVTLNFILLPIYKKTNITSFMILSPEMLESFRHVWYKSFIFDKNMPSSAVPGQSTSQPLGPNWSLI